MITGANLKNTDDLKKMWVITFIEGGKKNIVNGAGVNDVFQADKIALSQGFPNCSVPITVPLMETLEEAMKVLDTINKYPHLTGMWFTAEPATDILYVGWTMSTDDETGTAKFIPIFFPKEFGVKASSKEEIRGLALASIRDKIEKLLAVETSIKKAV